MVVGSAGCIPVASTSGRGQELRFIAAPICGRRLHVAVGGRLAGQRRCPAAQAAAFGNKKAHNKYKSRQDLEQDYYKEWEQTTVVADEDAKRKMTVWSLLAFLPFFVKFYVIPGPIRFVWYFIWSALRQVAYQLRKQAVIAGAKLDMQTMQRRRALAGYQLRATALRRLHGKDSLLAPVALMLGRQL